jgi:hypothetical protein
VRLSAALHLWAALGSSLCAIGCDRPTPLAPGEFTSIAPDIVLTFEYETPAFVVHAHRFSERDPFRVVVQTRQRGVRHCMSDGAFQKLIENFEALTIRRRVEETELQKLKHGRSYHRLRYVAAPPMEAYEEVLSPLPNGYLLLESQGFAYELSLQTRIVEQAGRSCGSSQARAEPAP